MYDLPANSAGAACRSPNVPTQSEVHCQTSKVKPQNYLDHILESIQSSLRSLQSYHNSNHSLISRVLQCMCWGSPMSPSCLVRASRHFPQSCCVPYFLWRGLRGCVNAVARNTTEWTQITDWKPDTQSCYPIKQSKALVLTFLHWP